MLISTSLVCACADSGTSEDGTGTDSTSGSPTSSEESGASGSETSETETGASETETGETETGGAEDPVCYPTGIYGECSAHPECQCLLGATVYQACTSSCTDASQCGDAADFPGSTPGCFPLNPGDPNMICVLLCSETSECPCDLECQPSGVPNVNICAEYQ